ISAQAHASGVRKSPLLSHTREPRSSKLIGHDVKDPCDYSATRLRSPDYPRRIRHSRPCSLESRPSSTVSRTAETLSWCRGSHRQRTEMQPERMGQLPSSRCPPQVLFLEVKEVCR